MPMNITLIVDQQQSFVQALRVAYNKAKQEGDLDEQTELSCQLAFENSDPAAIYHESDMICTSPQPTDGGMHFRAWNLRECYEQARINARRCVAESLANKISEATDTLKDELKASGTEFSERDLGFSINEKGQFIAKSIAGNPVGSAGFFITMLNENEKLRQLAYDYVRMVGSLVNFTLDGWDAPYASYLSRPEQNANAEQLLV